MAKGIDLGWAKPDDPIYSSGPMISFRPQLSESTSDTQAESVPRAGSSAPVEEVDRKTELAQIPKGRFAIFFDYLCWESGSCIDHQGSRPALFATQDDAEEYFRLRIHEMQIKLEAECAKVVQMNRSGMGVSGYTQYCVLFGADQPRNFEEWRELIVKTGEDGLLCLKPLIKRFDGFKLIPCTDGFYQEAIQFDEVDEIIYNEFSQITPAMPAV